MKYVYGIVLVCVILFTACTDLVKPEAPQPNMEEGFGRVSISFAGDGMSEDAEPQISASQKARTIFPVKVFEKYEYTFTKAGETTGTQIAPGSDGFFILAAGNYTVEVKAYVGNGEPYTLAASGKSQQFTVGSGSGVTVKVPLSGIAGGQGKLSYSITRPAGTEMQITLEKWPGLSKVTLNPSITGNLFSQTLSLDSGSYLLTVLINKTGFYGGLSEAIHIESFLTTQYTKVFTDSDLIEVVGGGAADTLAGKLLILQAYGSASDAAGVSHSFVELYNTTDSPINLSGISLYYAAGTRGLPRASEDGPWTRLSLSGTIPAKASFLIMGSRESTVARLKLTDNFGDINNAAFKLDNRSFKAAIIRSTANLTVQNPFNIDGMGTKVAGYIDMVGSANNPAAAEPDQILGFETAHTRNSKSEAVRRKNLVDTDDNSTDFVSIRYSIDGISNEEVTVRSPRNAKDGKAWDPFAPIPAPFETNSLMILQANTYGNDNGLDQTPPAPTGGGFSRSVVELYNNTSASINLGSGNYYLHIGNATEWTHAIKLTGTIPAKSSYLIVDNTPPSSNNTNTTARAVLPAADQSASFVLGNSGFKVAVIKNQSALLTVVNPYGNTSLASNYVDMIGTTGANGYEAATALQTKPQPPRRKHLYDTNDNSNDFGQTDLRGHVGSRGVVDTELYKIWPRNATMGAWNPISGIPRVDPVVVAASARVEPVFSHDSGLYTSAFSLTLSVPAGAPAGSTIYYTTDGSVPEPGKTGTKQYTTPISVINRNSPVQPNVLATSTNNPQFYNDPKDPHGSKDYAGTPYNAPDSVVPKATVIRAVVINNGAVGRVLTRTYFMNTNFQARYGNHRVISLVSDPYNLVDTDYGIMVRGRDGNSWIGTPGTEGAYGDIRNRLNMYNYCRRGREWERQAHMEVFDINRSSSILSESVGIRIRGGWSRAHGQKGFSVFFRNDWNENFQPGINELSNYPLISGAVRIDGTSQTKYKSFMLRTGGNDHKQTKFKDVLVHTLVKDRKFATEATIPSIVYINGEYWGPYNFSERYSAEYFEYKYGVPKNNVIMIEHGILDEGDQPGDYQKYKDMITAGRKDMTQAANYTAFCDLFDIDSFIDYWASNLIILNADWPDNNFHLWRARNVVPGNDYGDTKWRYMMHDTDYSMGIEGEKDAFYYPKNRAGTDTEGALHSTLLSSLTKNRGFSEKFVNTMMDLINMNFDADVCNKQIDDYKTTYQPLMVNFGTRWNYSYNFNTEAEKFRTFLNNVRTKIPENYIPANFGSDKNSLYTLGIALSSLRNVKLVTTGGIGNLPVKINTITPPAGKTLRYYAGIQVSVTASPAPAGYRFSGWNVTGGTAVTPSAVTSAINFTTGDVTITAMYESN